MYTLEDQPETTTEPQPQMDALDQVISDLYAQPVTDDPQWIQDTAEA
jgi:hypothetical protein